MNRQTVQKIISGVVFTVGFGVLAGWVFEISPLQHLLPGTSFMNPASAICFLILASCIYLLSFEQTSKALWNCITVGAAAVTVMGMLKLLTYTGVDTKIDSFFYKSELGLLAVDSNNRMAPNTAFNFFLAGVAVFAIQFRAALIKECALVGVGIVSLFAVFGFVFRIESFYGVANSNPMAPHTALCFTLVVVGLTISPPHRIFHLLFNNQSKSGKLGLKFLPVILLLPPILGHLRLLGEKNLSLYGTETGVALYTILMVISLITLLLFGMHYLNEHEVKLSQLNKHLEVRIEERLLELKKSENQVMQLQKLDSIGRLAGGVAHDFNNILAVINLYCYQLQQETSPAKINKIIEQIEKASERGAALTRQLLAFSRQQVVSFVPINLNHVISEFQKMLTRLIGENIKITTQLDPELAMFNGDKSGLEQVIMNLVVNARDAIQEGGCINIMTRNVLIPEPFSNIQSDIPAGSYVMLSVTDNGSGMDKATQEKIFDPFFTTKPVGKGTGLVLSTVFGIVKKMRGSIRVYSEIGVGTTFKVYLPAQTEAFSTAVSVLNEPIQNLSGNETILLVEDEEELRLMVSAYLVSLGYEVLSASNGLEAWSVLEKNGKVHLIVTDMVMPVMSGPALIQKVHETENLKGTKFLMLSGYIADTLDDFKDDWTNSAYFLEKPFSPVELGKKIRAILNS